MELLPFCTVIGGFPLEAASTGQHVQKSYATTNVNSVGTNQCVATETHEILGVE